MFDIAPAEFILFALVALVVIGPKDLPKAMRVVGRFVGKARGMASQFRSGFDAMVREAELEEMEKKWKAENARIMAEHSALPDVTPQPGPPLPISSPHALPVETPAEVVALPAPPPSETKPA